MRIAVYSGSFNPLHIGHLAIMKYMTEEVGYDFVYLIVSPMNPFKEGQAMAAGEERYKAAVEAVSRYEGLRVLVDSIELTLPQPNYTIRTLDLLKEREPENTFTLVIGADNLAAFTRWKDYQRILTEYGVAVFPREGFDIESIKEKLLEESTDYKIDILSAPIVRISSSEIRKGRSEGLDMSSWLM